MSYCITCSTKIFTLTITPFLFLFVGLICEFAMVPGVYILLSPQEEEVRFFSWRHRCTHSAAHLSKIFKALLHHVTVPIFLLNWKKCKQEIQICYGAYSETKYDFKNSNFFWFQWMSLRNLFHIKFLKFLVLYLDFGCIFMTCF